MIAGVDIDKLQRRLEERFGLELVHRHETIDGGIFSSLRPAGLTVGNGCSVLLARTPRLVEASFRADNFAGALLRTMWESDTPSRSTFGALLAQARAAGADIYVSVDGGPPDVLPESPQPWRRLVIDVRRNIAIAAAQEATLFEEALSVASICLSLTLTIVPTESLERSVGSEDTGLPEGAKVRIEVNRYERSPANRAVCIAHYGAVCQLCGFSFGDIYGKRGQGFIEVHHKVPVSKLGGSYFVDPIEDLVPLCSNCHSIIHRTNPPLSVEDTRALILASRDGKRVK